GVLGEDVDQFEDEIAISAGGGGEEGAGDRSADGEILLQGRAYVGEDVGPAVDKALVVHFPGAPVATGIGGGDGAPAVRNGVRGVGQIFAVRRTVLGRIEAQSAVGVQVQAGALGAWGRPSVVRMPGVGSALKGLCLPGELFALAVQPEAEEGRLYLFPE